MPLDPQLVDLFSKFTGLGYRSWSALTPTEARAQMAALAPKRPPTPVGKVDNTSIAGVAGPIAVRLYRPQRAGQERLPVLVYLHGGGHVLGNLDSHDETSRNLANGAGALVVAVDYRLAPEHKFPAAAEDSFAAVKWAAAEAGRYGGDGSRLAVAGDSAGGNLAAVAALMAREAGGPKLAMQVLVYPVADYACDNTPSYETFASGLGILDSASMRWFRNHYLRTPEDVLDWRASPLRAGDLSGLPPALVLLAECDPLHDEGLAYAERLRQSGNSVELVEFPGMAHGFFGWRPVVPASETAQALACTRLKAAWS
ncbi:MAG: alpha/beta hydrolase [Alphaproteobacteria bacterium]|nr:alpha/beta hydrolase [Alphaproteobacteria bacterium]